jgi:hypothetical protein
MKRLSPLFFICLLSCKNSTFSQRNEFTINSNGLIYNEQTMSNLHHIVDSLHLKFRVCEPKTFYAKLQAMGHYVQLSKQNIKAAAKDMEKGMPFKSFISKYNSAKTSENRLIVRYEYLNDEKEQVIEFNTVGLHENGTSIFYTNEPNRKTNSVKNTWLYRYNPKNEYSDEYVYAFYMIEDFKYEPLTPQYAHLVQYVDCMVDTSTTIFLDKATDEPRFWGAELIAKTPHVQAFLNFVEPFPNEPHFTEKYDSGDSLFYDKAIKHQRIYQAWDSLRQLNILKLSATPQFKTLLHAATQEVLKDTIYHPTFDSYLAKYSKETALFLKRNRIVVGSCSQDQSPRYHAQDIAILSAETAKWDVFLRAHLDIMNDNFRRNSDGNYAWGGRKTYIKELETLDINVLDLLLGISLRVENPPRHHYYGSIGRLGRALSETKQQDVFEQKALAMITDTTLDTYNRLLMYRILYSYNGYLEDKNRQKNNKVALKKSLATLPKYLSQDSDKD